MKTYKIKVNGKVYMVEVEEVTGTASADQAAQPAQAPAAQAPAPQAPAAQAPAAPSQGGYRVESPMQGIIMSVKTPAGTPVKRGQVLAILEAMKLENEIVSPVDGTVGQVNVKDGQVVDSGTLILTINQ